MDYNILFIDEESTQHDQFMDYFEQVCPEIVPQCEFPLATVDEMLQRIEELSPDAVVTDFRLNEMRIDIHYNVKYNGIDLINAIREQREGFPCFVITSFDDEAVKAEAMDLCIGLSYYVIKRTLLTSIKRTILDKGITDVIESEKWLDLIKNEKKESK